MTVHFLLLKKYFSTGSFDFYYYYYYFSFQYYEVQNNTWSNSSSDLGKFYVNKRWRAYTFCFLASNEVIDKDPPVCLSSLFEILYYSFEIMQCINDRLHNCLRLAPLSCIIDTCSMSLKFARKYIWLRKEPPRLRKRIERHLREPLKLRISIWHSNMRMFCKQKPQDFYIDNRLILKTSEINFWFTDLL